MAAKTVSVVAIVVTNAAVSFELVAPLFFGTDPVGGILSTRPRARRPSAGRYLSQRPIAHRVGIPPLPGCIARKALAVSGTTRARFGDE